MNTSENYALLILGSLEANPEKILLRINEDQESFTAYSGSEIKQQVFYRLHQLKRKPAQAVLFIPFGSEHIFWTLALMLRGVTLLDLPITNLRRELITGPKRTIILPQKGLFLLGLLFRLQGNRVIRFQKNGKSSDIKIDPSPENPALISFSTGSKGVPKQVDRSHTALIHQHLALKKSFPDSAEAVNFPLFPLNVLFNLAAGVCTVLPPLDWDHWENFYAGDMLDSIKQEHVTSLIGNVFFYHKLLRSARKMNYVLNTVNEVHIGGSPAPEWILADLQSTFPNARIFIRYGTTEAELIAIREYKRQRDPLLGYCVGVPHPDITLTIDKKGSFKRGESSFEWGEICVGGAFTGDMGYLMKGELYLIGRKDNKEPLGDYFPFQIEHYLVDQLDIQDIAVVVRAGSLHVYYESAQNEDEAIKNCINDRFGQIRHACKRIQVIPKDERHHSKTLYAALEEDPLD